MPGVDFNALRNEITMEDVLNQLGFVPASQTGDQLHGPCPVHGSTSAGGHRSQSGRSLSVNLQTGRYYCHKCQSHGNQLELWAAVHRLPIYEAAIDLCRAPPSRRSQDRTLVTITTSREQRRGTGTSDKLSI